MRNRGNGSRLFLTELMFAILFFIVISAVCVQCFAASFVRSKEANQMTEAVGVTTNAAELYLSDVQDTDFTIYYDEDWKEVSEEGKYKLTGIITAADDTGLESMSLRVSTMEDEKEIYSLVVEKAIPLE
ncbi:MAG: hypothetical protein K6E79_08835 [Pseudobutyrivibrio sp.]|nr:hypothetical protein [Pseudobutyrivibrio sp.]